MLNTIDKNLCKLSGPRGLRLTILFAALAAMISGCASSEQAQQMQRSIISNQGEILQLRQETQSRLAKLEREQEALSKQVVGMYSAIENRDEKIKGLLGKIDELEYQLKTYWADTKKLLASKTKSAENGAVPKTVVTNGQGKDKEPSKEPRVALDAKYEEAYKNAFEVFQKGNHKEAIQRFSQFIESYGGTPLAANAYYWIGESYMSLKNYDKAIVFFQEIIDRYPKSEKAPRAMISQAEAFRVTNDKKSSITILKRVIELYPKSEEATIAERKLRSGNL